MDAIDEMRRSRDQAVEAAKQERAAREELLKRLEGLEARDRQRTVRDGFVAAGYPAESADLFLQVEPTDAEVSPQTIETFASSYGLSRETTTEESTPRPQSFAPPTYGTPPAEIQTPVPTLGEWKALWMKDPRHAQELHDRLEREGRLNI